MHFFEIISLNKNADISIFVKKEGKDISTQISLEFAFTEGNSKHIYKTTW